MPEMAYAPVAQAPASRELSFFGTASNTGRYTQQEGGEDRVSAASSRLRRHLHGKLAAAVLTALLLLAGAVAWASAASTSPRRSGGSPAKTPAVVARLYAAAAAGGSCAVFGCSAEYAQGNACQCNMGCSAHSNCCEDFAAVCPSGGGAVPPPGAAYPAQPAAPYAQPAPFLAPATPLPAAYPIYASEPVAAPEQAPAPPAIPQAPPPVQGGVVGSTLYCFALALPWGYEIGLLRNQYERRAALFECEAYQIFSNVTLELVPGVQTYNLDIPLFVRNGGKWGTALNTDVFISVWNAVKYNQIYLRYDWSIKVDIDTVFFAQRFRDLVVRRTADRIPGTLVPTGAVFLNNCHYGLHGPLEALSKEGMIFFLNNFDQCEYIRQAGMDIFPYGLPPGISVSDHAYGEDEYLSRCLRYLNVAEVDEFETLLGEKYACDERPVDCGGMKVGFHAYKNEVEWFQCYDFAQQQGAWPSNTPPTTPAPTQAPAPTTRVVVLEASTEAPTSQPDTPGGLFLNRIQNVFGNFGHLLGH